MYLYMCIHTWIFGYTFLKYFRKFFPMVFWKILWLVISFEKKKIWIFVNVFKSEVLWLFHILKTKYFIWNKYLANLHNYSLSALFAKHFEMNFENYGFIYNVYTYIHLYLHVKFLNNFQIVFVKHVWDNLECCFLTRNSHLFPFCLFSLLLFFRWFGLIAVCWHSTLGETLWSYSQCFFIWV